MANGELICCLELFIMCVECIKIDFSGIDDVSFWWRSENLNL